MNETDYESDITDNHSQDYDYGKLLIHAMLCLLIFRIFVFLRNKITTMVSKRVGNLTRTPIIPFSRSELYELYEYERNYMANVIPDVKILCCDSTKKYCTSKKIDNLVKELFEIKIRPYDNRRTRLRKMKPIPTNARVVSIKMSGFKHGNKVQNFIPIDGIIDGSQFTYQMFGDNRIQVTNYVENGVSYVAGFCIYFDKPGLRDAEFPTEVIRKAWYSNHKYTGRNYISILNVQQVDETVRLLAQHFQVPPPAYTPMDNNCSNPSV